jgi:hypothetical protein
VNGPRDHDTAWRSLCCQPRRNIDTITMASNAIDDQVAKVQADAVHDGRTLSLILVGIGHALSELNRGVSYYDTGVRRSDVVKLGRGRERDGHLDFTTTKAALKKA